MDEKRIAIVAGLGLLLGVMFLVFHKPASSTATTPDATSGNYGYGGTLYVPTSETNYYYNSNNTTSTSTSTSTTTVSNPAPAPVVQTPTPVAQTPAPSPTPVVQSPAPAHQTITVTGQGYHLNPNGSVTSVGTTTGMSQWNPAAGQSEAQNPKNTYINLGNGQAEVFDQFGEPSTMSLGNAQKLFAS